MSDDHVSSMTLPCNCIASALLYSIQQQQMDSNAVQIDVLLFLDSPIAKCEQCVTSKRIECARGIHASHQDISFKRLLASSHVSGRWSSTEIIDLSYYVAVCSQVECAILYVDFQLMKELLLFWLDTEKNVNKGFHLCQIQLQHIHERIFNT